MTANQTACGAQQGLRPLSNIMQASVELHKSEITAIPCRLLNCSLQPDIWQRLSILGKWEVCAAAPAAMLVAPPQCAEAKGVYLPGQYDRDRSREVAYRLVHFGDDSIILKTETEWRRRGVCVVEEEAEI
jgi:hypothetical protein